MRSRRSHRRQMRLLLLAALAVWLALPTSAAALPCLSKAEARHRFHGSHLYWHGEDHCWDNRRHAFYSPTRKPAKVEEDREPVSRESHNHGDVKLVPDVPHPKPAYPPPIELEDLDAAQKFTPWHERVSGAFRHIDH